MSFNMSFNPSTRQTLNHFNYGSGNTNEAQLHTLHEVAAKIQHLATLFVPDYSKTDPDCESDSIFEPLIDKLDPEGQLPICQFKPEEFNNFNDQDLSKTLDKFKKYFQEALHEIKLLRLDLAEEEWTNQELKLSNKEKSTQLKLVMVKLEHAEKRLANFTSRTIFSKEDQLRQDIDKMDQLGMKLEQIGEEKPSSSESDDDSLMQVQLTSRAQLTKRKSRKDEFESPTKRNSKRSTEGENQTMQTLNTIKRSFMGLTKVKNIF